MTRNEVYIIVIGDSNSITFISHLDKCIELVIPCDLPNLKNIDLTQENDYLLVTGQSNSLTIIDIISQKSVTSMLFFDIAKKIQYLQSPEAYYMDPRLKKLYHE